MSVNEEKTIFKSKSKSYVKIKIAGQGAFSCVFLVEGEISKEK